MCDVPRPSPGVVTAVVTRRVVTWFCGQCLAKRCAVAPRIALCVGRTRRVPAGVRDCHQCPLGVLSRVNSGWPVFCNAIHSQHRPGVTRHVHKEWVREEGPPPRQAMHMPRLRMPCLYHQSAVGIPSALRAASTCSLGILIKYSCSLSPQWRALRDTAARANRSISGNTFSSSSISMTVARV